MRTFIPNKIISIRLWDNPWHTTELRRLRRRRDRLHKKAKRTATFTAWELYRQDRNLYVKEIKQAKLSYEQRQMDKINNFAPESSRSWWQTVKVFYKSKRSSIPSVQLPNGNVTNDPILKATMFNNFFISSSNLDTTTPLSFQYITRQNLD